VVMPSDPQAVLARRPPSVEQYDELARALAESEKRVRMLEALDGPFRWLGEHYPKAFREMPTEYIRAFDTARAALLEGGPDAR